MTTITCMHYFFIYISLYQGNGFLSIEQFAKAYNMLFDYDPTVALKIRSKVRFLEKTMK